MSKQKDEKTKITYPIYQARVSEDIKTWLKKERGKYGSANKLFKELIRIYES